MATIKQTSVKITQELGKLERALKIKLKQFYNKNIKNSQKSLYQIRQDSGQSLENEIRNTIQSSWLFSNQIIQDTIGSQVNISTKDVQGIEKTTDTMVNSFWNTAFKLQNRETEFKLNSNQELVQMQPLDLTAAMGAASAYFTYYAFNLGMMSKADELGFNIKLRFTVRSDCVDTKICRPLEGKLFDIGNVPYQPPLHKHCHCHLIPIIVPQNGQ